MSRAEAWLVHLSALAVGLTGLAYGWMRYLCEPVDEFAVAHHPLEPSTKAAHIIAAPFLVFALAWIGREHVWARIADGWRPRRTTGIALAVVFAPLALSGYFIQTVDAGRDVWIWTHGLLGVVFVAGYAWHQLSPRAGRRARSRSDSGRTEEVRVPPPS